MNVPPWAGRGNRTCSMYVCMYVSRSKYMYFIILARTTSYCTLLVQYSIYTYILAEMYGVDYILTMCSNSTKYSLYMTSVPIPQWIGT